jgi:MFS family permease
MSGLTNLRGLGTFLGAAVGSALGIVLVLLVVFLTPGFAIRWPVPPDVVLLVAFGLPVLLTALIGVSFGPSVPSWSRRVSVALRGDQAELEATKTDSNRLLVLHVSRGFTAIYLVLGLVMTALGVFLVLVVAGSEGLLVAVVGWACLLFFGLITVLLLVQFTWPMRFGLTLEMEGFTVTMNLGSRRYRWADVEGFFPYNTVALQPVVAFKYRGKAEIHGLQWTRGAFRTFDGTLPQNLSIRGLALLDLMERWRSRAKGTDR